MFAIFEAGPAEGKAILGAMNTVLTQEGSQSLSDIEVRTLKSIGRSMFHMDVDPISLPTSFVDDLPTLIVSEELKSEVLHFAALLPFLSLENEPERMALVESLGNILGQHDQVVTDLKKLAEGRKTKFVVHAFRDIKKATGKSMLGTMVGLLKGKLHLDGDAKLLEAYQSYQSLPANTVGHQLARYYVDNQFDFPGTAGSGTSNTLFRHDFHHVLAGYPTTPLGEMCLGAFESGHLGSSKDDLMRLAVMSLLQLQLGIDLLNSGAEDVWKNQFEPEPFFRAYERGGKVDGTVFAWDFDIPSIAEQPLAEARERYGIEADGALVLNVDDPWCGLMGPVAQRESPDIVSHGKVLTSSEG